MKKDGIIKTNINGVEYIGIIMSNNCTNGYVPVLFVTCTGSDDLKLIGEVNYIQHNRLSIY